MSPTDKPLIWLHGEIKTPPLSAETRREAGFHLRRLQRGDRLGMPTSRSMPSIGSRCRELRLTDGSNSTEWRIVYRVDSDAIVIVEVFQKKSQATPQHVVDKCKRRLAGYDEAAR